MKWFLAFQRNSHLSLTEVLLWVIVIKHPAESRCSVVTSQNKPQTWQFLQYNIAAVCLTTDQIIMWNFPAVFLPKLIPEIDCVGYI